MTIVIWQLEGPRWFPPMSGALMLSVSWTSHSTWPLITWESREDSQSKLEHSKNQNRKLQGFFLPHFMSIVFYQPNLTKLRSKWWGNWTTPPLMGGATKSQGVKGLASGRWAGFAILSHLPENLRSCCMRQAVGTYDSGKAQQVGEF